jgi:hypothetical protein
MKTAKSQVSTSMRDADRFGPYRFAEAGRPQEGGSEDDRPLVVDPWIC